MALAVVASVELGLCMKASATASRTEPQTQLVAEKGAAPAIKAACNEVQRSGGSFGGMASLSVAMRF